MLSPSILATGADLLRCSFRLPRTGRGGDGTEGRGGALRLTLALEELQLELSLGAESPPFSFQLGREWDGRDSSCGTKVMESDYYE